MQSEEVFSVSIFNEIFKTEGRLNRLRYLKYMVLLAVVGGLATFVTSCMAAFLTGSHESSLVTIVTGIWGIAAVVGNVMLVIRRLHDLDKSGWFALIAIIPVIGFIFSIYLFFAPGTVGYNRFGADPLSY